ncbi:hypothetical protein [Streptomyces sp. NPDC048650]|uniref:hypothetical protein n=1 Tax=unclassified Streptomyces TaxID=2593676 RepID=UPI003721F43C
MAADKSDVRRWSGWRGREIEVAKEGLGRPLVLSVAGGWTSEFAVHPVKKTRHRVIHGGGIIGTTGRRPHRLVLPATFTHVTVERRMPQGSAGGFARWRLSEIPAAALTELTDTRPCSGAGYDVLRYIGGPVSVEFRFEGDGQSGGIRYDPVSGGEQVVVDSSSYRRGTFRIPGPVLISMPDCEGWRLSVG